MSSGYHAVAGGSVAELGDTLDPRDLIPGDPEAVDKSLSGMRKLGFGMSRAAEGLAGTEASHWQGQAGDAFRARFAGKPAQWRDAGEAFWEVADALITYRDVLRTAQKDAAQAIVWYGEAQAATEKATEEYNAAADRYNDALDAGQDPGPRPQWNDPGKELRTRAENLLTDARNRVTNAGYECGQVISGWVGRMPEEPDAWDRFWMDAGDVVAFLGTQTADMATGAAEAVGEMIRFARTTNPTDPYNVTHPSEYWGNMEKLAAGITHAASHPRETILAIADVETWRDSPGKALGKLLPDVIGGGFTGGVALAGRTAGRTVTAAAREAVEDAGTLGRDAAESVGRQVADTSARLGGFDRGLFDRLGPEAYSRLQAFPQQPPPGVMLGKVGDSGVGTSSGRAPDVATPPAGTGHPSVTPPRAEPPATMPNPVLAEAREMLDRYAQPSTPPATSAVGHPTVRYDWELPDAEHAKRVAEIADAKRAEPPSAHAVAETPAARPEPTTTNSTAEPSPEPRPEPSAPRDPEPEPATRDPEPAPDPGPADRIQADLDANGSEFPVEQLDPDWKWRDDRNYLYRVDDRGDDEIWTNGFQPKDPANFDLNDYVTTNKDSAFVSTSTRQDIWHQQADRNYMYVIDARGGIDVNASVPQHLFQSQDEIALPGGVSGSRVIGRYRLYTDPETGRRELSPEFELNPYAIG